MGRQEDEIQRKLDELEASIEKDPSTVLKVTDTKLVETKSSLGPDLNIFCGGALVLAGLLMFFNHVKVGTGLLSWFSFTGHGFGFLIIPLMIGLGMIFYNPKNKIGWMITAASCAVVFFSVLSMLGLYFPSVSFLGLILMFLPFAIGGALITKGILAQKNAK